MKVRGFIYFNSKIEKSEFYFASLIFVDSDGRIIQYKFLDTRKVDQSIFLIKPVPIGNDDLDNLVNISEGEKNEETMNRDKRRIDLEKPKMQPSIFPSNTANGPSTLNIFTEPHRNNSQINSNSIFDASNQPIKTIWTDPSLNNINLVQIKNETTPNIFNQTTSLNLFPKEPEASNFNLNSNTGFLFSSSQTSLPAASLPANNMFMTNKNDNMNANRNNQTPTTNLFDKPKVNNTSFLFSSQNNFSNSPKIDFEIKRNNNITVQRLNDPPKNNESMNRNFNLDIFSNKNQLNPDPPKFMQGNHTISPINANVFSPQNNLSSSFKISPILNSPFEGNNSFSTQSLPIPSFQNVNNNNHQKNSNFLNNFAVNNENKNENMINLNKDNNFVLSNGINASSISNPSLTKPQFNLSNSINNQIAFNQPSSNQKNSILNNLSNQNLTFNVNENPLINANNMIKNNEISFFPNKPRNPPNLLSVNNNANFALLTNNHSSFDLNSTNRNSLNISNSSEKQTFYFNKHLANVKKQESDLKTNQKEFKNFLYENISKIKFKFEDYLKLSSQQRDSMDDDSNNIQKTRGFLLFFK